MEEEALFGQAERDNCDGEALTSGSRVSDEFA